jgi:hypothetical protein
MSAVPALVQTDWFLKLKNEEPIAAALCEMLASEMDAFMRAVPGASPTKQNLVDALAAFSKSIREIVSWLAATSEQSPEASTDNSESKAAWMKWCLDSGGSTVQAVEVGKAFDETLKGKPGRHPAPSRGLAIRYIEQKLKTPALNLPTFTRGNCPCGKERHDGSCAEVIRQQVIALKRVFAKHGLTWPLSGV